MSYGQRDPQGLQDLHLRAMVLLGMGKIQDAVQLFQRGLASARRAEHSMYFRTGLAIAALRERSYSRAIEELGNAPQSTLGARVLLFHAYAGARQRERLREVGKVLEAEGQRLRPDTMAVVTLIRSAYAIDAPDGPREPDDNQLQEIIHAEAELALAA